MKFLRNLKCDIGILGTIHTLAVFSFAYVESLKSLFLSASVELVIVLS